MAVEALADFFPEGGQKTCEQRVILREPAAPDERAGPDQRAVAFGQGQQAVPAPFPVYSAADDKHRSLAGVQRRAQRIDRGRLGAHGRRHLAGVHRLRQHFPVIHRDRHEGRAIGRLHGNVVGPGNGGRYVFGAGRFAAPLHVRLGQFGRLRGQQEGFLQQQRTGLLAGGDHQRSAVAVGGEDVAHRMADASRRMQVDEGGIVGGLGVPVGHAHHHRLLQPQHVAEVAGEILEHRQFGRPRVPEDLVDAQFAQQLECGIANADQCLVRHPVSPRNVGGMIPAPAGNGKINDPVRWAAQPGDWVRLERLQVSAARPVSTAP